MGCASIEAALIGQQQEVQHLEDLTRGHTHALTQACCGRIQRKARTLMPPNHLKHLILLISHHGEELKSFKGTSN